jgi:hypothetical protein
LDEFGRDVGYYVPPELRSLLGLAADMTPTATLERAGQASQRMLDADRTAMERVGDFGAMLSETAGVAAPMMVANRAALPVADAIQEGLLGFSVGAQDVGRAVADRLNQPGPVPTMYSNPLLGPIGSSPEAPQTYEMVGSEIAERLRDIPTAIEVAGGEAPPPGSGFSGLTGQRFTILPEHYSAGVLPTDLETPVPQSWQSLTNRTLFGLVGDPTAMRQVNQIGEEVLTNPVMSEAGAEFIDRGNQGWASARSAMAAKQAAMERADNPYALYLNMGDQSGDFSVHMGRAVGEAFRAAPISSNAVPEIDDTIRNIGMSVTEPVFRADGTPELTARGNPKTRSYTVRPFQDFTTVADPDAVFDYIMSLPSGAQRAAFVKGLDKSGLQRMGVPNVGDIRLALANPDLIGRDWLTAGYRGFTPDTETGLLSTPPEVHSTYDTMIQRVGPSETLDAGGRGVPANLVFRNLSEQMREKGTGGRLIPTSADYKVYESSPNRAQQPMDDMAVELTSTFSEIENRFGRRAALQYANELLSGGRITAEMINAARRANAPSWMLAALAPASGLLSMMPEDEQQ